MCLLSTDSPRLGGTGENAHGFLYCSCTILDLRTPFELKYNTASNLCLLLQKELNVKGGEGPSGKQAVGINNGTR